MPKWMFFINALLLLWSVTLARTLPPILWDKNSANFTANGLNITVEINDLIDIECPKTENTTAGRLKAQYHKFTQVSSQGYRQCSLDAGRQRHLLSCNRPFVENKLTLLFQEHTPYPGGATFSHGENYYFITTSNGSANGIDNRSGGLCRSNNMRLRVYVKPKPTGRFTTICTHHEESEHVDDDNTAYDGADESVHDAAGYDEEKADDDQYDDAAAIDSKENHKKTDG
ncbi:ephrin-B2-like [Diadema antillarum]|uniref:ephrin-B2-like n=1 Tax=Diadema antillarum TaxID=105358 RepID=UPI003A87DAF4